MRRLAHRQAGWQACETDNSVLRSVERLLFPALSDVRHDRQMAHASVRCDTQLHASHSLSFPYAALLQSSVPPCLVPPSEDQARALAPLGVTVVEGPGGQKYWHRRRHPLFTAVCLELLTEVVNSRWVRGGQLQVRERWSTPGEGEVVNSR